MVQPLPKQTNYEDALAHALAAAAERAPEHLSALGAEETGPGRLELPVLDATFLADLNQGKVTLAGARLGEDTIHIQWQILALHYLAAPVPLEPSSRWINFAELEAAARVYESVYRGRVLGRLCATAGRDRDTFVEAGLRLNGERLDWGGGDAGFRFRVFPKLAVAISWYAGDDEFPPSASFVYPDNITSFISLEDVVVLSERVVSRLQGGAW